MEIFLNFRQIKLLMKNKLTVISIFFFNSNILVGLKIDYTCLGGSWNGKVWEPLVYDIGS